MAVHQRKELFADAVRGADNQPPVDIYVNTPPCQSFSANGKKKALKDKRGRLLKIGVKYAAACRPKVWILENVPTLVTWKKFKHIKNGLVSALEEIGYVVHVKVLDAQNR